MTKSHISIRFRRTGELKTLVRFCGGNTDGTRSHAAFRNQWRQWIYEAIERSLSAHAMAPLDVMLVHFAEVRTMHLHVLLNLLATLISVKSLSFIEGNLENQHTPGPLLSATKRAVFFV